MRKFLPLVLCGLAALSYSQLGAAADADPGEKAATDARGSATTGATTDSTATRDAQAGVRQDKDNRLGTRKHEGDASSGSSSTNNPKSMEKDDSTSPAPSSSKTPGSTPKGVGY